MTQTGFEPSLRQLPFARFLKPLLGLVLLATLCWQLDGLKILSLVAGADITWLLLGFFAYVLSNLASAWRWQCIVRHLGVVPSFASMLCLYAQGITLNTLLPGGIVGGDVWRSMQLSRFIDHNKAQLGLHQAALSVFLDRVGGLWGLAIWSTIALALAAMMEGSVQFRALTGQYFVHGYLVLLLTAAIVPVLALRLVRFCLKRPEPVAGGAFPKKWLAHLQHLDSLWRTLPQSIVVQLLATLALWACLQALSQPLAYLPLAGLCFAIFLSAVVPASIGGFGARELACVVILGWVGIAEEAAFTASILFGFLGLLQGGLGTFCWFKK